MRDAVVPVEPDLEEPESGRDFMKLKAFVFDDDDNVRSLLACILERRGYKVLSFPDPSHYSPCSDKGCSCPPGQVCGDILITDKNMPNMTGLEFIENQMQHGCKCFAQNRAVVSGMWTEAERARARTLGCHIIDKPFRIAELNRWLDECERRVALSRKPGGRQVAPAHPLGA